MRFVIFFMVLASCSGEPKEVLLNPQPKTLEVGESATFNLDPSQSSKFVTSGDMKISVESVNSEGVNFAAKVRIDTKFGPQNVEIKQAVSTEVTTKEFLVGLRSYLEYVGDGYKLRYVGMNDDGCDQVMVYDIEKYKGVVITPTFCVSARTVPMIVVEVDMYGVPVNLVFLQGS